MTYIFFYINEFGIFFTMMLVFGHDLDIMCLSNLNKLKKKDFKSRRFPYLSMLISRQNCIFFLTHIVKKRNRWPPFIIIDFDVYHLGLQLCKNSNKSGYMPFGIVPPYQTWLPQKILVSDWSISKKKIIWNWTKTWWEAPMEGSVLSFLKAEWKVSDTGSAH